MDVCFYCEIKHEGDCNFLRDEILLKHNCQVPVEISKNGKKHKITFPSVREIYGVCNEQHIEFDCPFFKEYLNIRCFNCMGAGHTWNYCHKLKNITPSKQMVNRVKKYISNQKKKNIEIKKIND